MNKEPSDQPSPDPDRWQALARYLAGESAPKEAAEIEQWLASNPQRAELIAALDRSLQRFSTPGAAVDVDGALQRVKSRFGEAEVREFRPRTAAMAPEQFNRRWSRTLTRLAAAIIVVLGVSLIWRVSQKEPMPVTVAAAQVFTTAIGQTDSVRLADGSLVVLAPSSHLVVAEGYGARARVVELNGEALFDVQHDANRPFSVQAGAATIRDLGTTFVVRNIATEAVQVAVTKGSVVLHAYAQEQDGVVLRAGDRGMLDREGKVVAERGRVTEQDVAFAAGRLIFEDATLDEVSAQLRRWYGVELRVVDEKLANRHITAAFNGESAQQVLNVIGLALGARIELNGDTAFVRSTR